MIASGHSEGECSGPCLCSEHLDSLSEPPAGSTLQVHRAVGSAGPGQRCQILLVYKKKRSLSNSSKISTLLPIPTPPSQAAGFLKGHTIPCYKPCNVLKKYLSDSLGQRFSIFYLDYFNMSHPYRTARAKAPLSCPTFPSGSNELNILAFPS